MITSRQNPALKAIRALRDRKEREQTGLVYIEGIRIVGEAVQLGAHIQTLLVAPDLLKSQFAHELIEQLKIRQTEILELNADAFHSLSDKHGPQGIAAVVKQSWGALDGVEALDGVWVALHASQDPGNIGTVMRTADAVGARGLILIDDCADPYDAGAIRASMGALFSQTLMKCSTQAFVDFKARSGVRVVGASDKGAVDYRAEPYISPMCLLMGSEREGLSPELLAACDTVVSLPMRGRGDSLNVAIAAGVLLYAIDAALHPLTA